MPFTSSRALSGFTLVELSIVLVIIGLILGGVMVGQSMIRQTQVNRILTDFQQYQAAQTMFVDKYNFLPGDLPNATTFFTGTANGNGDGSISIFGENFLYWQHMALAGYVKGSYTGVAGPANAWDAVIGINIPVGAIKGAGYMVMTKYSSSYFFTPNGASTNDWGLLFAMDGDTSGAVLTPQEAYAFDLKTDDGIPGTGRIQSTTQVQTPNRATTNVTATAVYNLSYTGKACVLHLLF